MDITDLIRGPATEGRTTTADRFAALSPYLRAHINQFGAYSTDDETTHRPDPFGPAFPGVDFTTFDLAA